MDRPPARKEVKAELGAGKFADFADGMASGAGDPARAGDDVFLVYPSPSKADLEDVRRMNPHQKATYWQVRLNYMAALVGRSDGRTERQAADFASKRERSSDASLMQKVSVLRWHLEMCAKASKLSPSQVVGLTGSEYESYVRDFVKNGTAFPAACQEGFLARRMKRIEDQSTYGVEFFRAISPWSSNLVEGEPEPAFDPMLPAVAAMNLAD